MALKPCKECGHEISAKAKNCPHCGIEIPQKKGCIRKFVFLVIGFFILVAIFPKGDPDKKDAEPEVSSQVVSPSVPINFEVLKRKMLNDALVISVRTEDFEDAEEVARQIVEVNKDEYMVRVFFYQPGHKPGIDIPVIRYEWTQTQGLIKSFDLRTPIAISQPVAKSPSPDNLSSPSLDIIGKWKDSAWPAVITMYHEKGILFMEYEFGKNTTSKGSTYKKEMISEVIMGQTRFREKDENSHGDYYVVDGQGNLGIYDGEGFIRTALSIQ